MDEESIDDSKHTDIVETVTPSFARWNRIADGARVQRAPEVEKVKEEPLNVTTLDGGAQVQVQSSTEETLWKQVADGAQDLSAVDDARDQNVTDGALVQNATEETLWKQRQVLIPPQDQQNTHKLH